MSRNPTVHMYMVFQLLPLKHFIHIASSLLQTFITCWLKAQDLLSNNWGLKDLNRWSLVGIEPDRIKNREYSNNNCGCYKTNCKHISPTLTALSKYWQSEFLEPLFIRKKYNSHVFYIKWHISESRVIISVVLVLI